MGRKSATSAVSGPSPRHSAAKKANRPSETTGCSLRSCAYSSARFAALTLSSLGLSTLLFSLSWPITQGDLAWTSRHLESWIFVAALLGYRVLELGIAWLLEFDAQDVADFVQIVNIPTWNFLYSFYGVRPTTLLTVAMITVLSNSLPFLYFRRTNPSHFFFATSDRPILSDRQTAIYTILVAASIQTVALYINFVTWLPQFLVTHFDNLPSVQVAYDGAKGLAPIFISLLPIGYALRDLLLISPSGHSDAEVSGPVYEEKHGELFAVSLYRQCWVALRQKKKTLVMRTTVLVVMTFANTMVQLAGTMSGATIEGAAGWALIWVGAIIAVSMMYGWIDAADGVETKAPAPRKSTRKT